MNMCENLTDPKNHWVMTNGTSTFNPVVNGTHTYFQNCTVWSIDFRKNETHCPARMRPDCFLMSPNNYTVTCPIAPSQHGGFVTTELCECLGVTKTLMKIGHPIYCICTRNLNKPELINAGVSCNQHYLFTKKCTVQWPYTVQSGASVINRYYFNCSFVDCHELDTTPLFYITGFNKTCSNATTMDKIYTTKKPPTTTTTTTTTALPTTKTSTTTSAPTTTTTTTTPTPTPTTTKTTTATSTTTPTSTTTTTSTTTSATTTTTTNPTSQAKESISSTANKSIKSEITAIKTTSQNGPSYGISSLRQDTPISRDSNISLMELPPSHVEYSKQMNQGSLLGILLCFTVLQLFVMLGVGFKVKKHRKEHYSY